jgi:DNA-binding NarL/FixJ family response regulator
MLHTGFEVNSVHSVDAAIARFILILYAGQPEPTEPVNKKSKTETERNEDIRRRFTNGQSIGSIARHYGLSKQRVHQIIHGRRK